MASAIATTRRSRNRARMRRIAGWLLLGAIINIAVAWGCATTHNRLCGIGPLAQHACDDLWQKYAPSDLRPATEEYSGYWIDRVGHHRKMVVLDPRAGPPVTACVLGRFEFGWPLRSMFGVIIATDAPRRSSVKEFRWFLPSPVHVKSPQLHSGKVPAGIVPLGFAINTILYAAIPWVLFACPVSAVRLVRGRRRRRRGLCPACAYNLRGSSHGACPECGTPIRARDVESVV